MAGLLDRVRAALAPDYEVERELGGGGMGVVYLARDTTLERPVAVKVLRPEMATAEAAERFLREARLLARLSHPNIVPVHQAGEAGGLFYYIMDYMDGATLADRLKRGGALAPARAVEVARDLLAALAAAHAVGVVHRDVKPGNIFLLDHRVLLGDFGIATPPAGAERLTMPGRTPGTPRYMAPEQAIGEEVSPRTDLYAVGIVLYEMLTGRPWSALSGVEEADWSGVPRDLVAVLRSALRWSPEARWPDAESFRSALGRGGRGRRWRGAALAAGVTVAIAASVLVLVVTRQAPATGLSDLAVMPLEVVGGPDSLGEDLASLVQLNLEGLHGLLTLTPAPYAFNRWERRDLSTPVRSDELLQARHLARGSISQSECRLEVRVQVLRASGTPLPGQVEASGSCRDLRALGDSVAAQIVGIVAPELAPEYRGLDAVNQHAWAAVREFLQGQRAFRRNAWLPAERHYEAAVHADPTFGLAWWRLANVWRWKLTGHSFSGDLPALVLRGGELPELDRLLIEAQLAPAGKPRFEAYRRAVDRYPKDGFAWFLYGDALFHRGPLVGYPLPRAVEILREAAARDSFLAPAYDHLTWALIRLGLREEGRRTLDHYRMIAAPPEDLDFPLPLYLEQAFLERFDPDAARSARSKLFGGPGADRKLDLAARGGLTFDVPESEVEFGSMLVAAAPGRPLARADGHEAQGLGLVALGRMSAALAQFDSAAALFQTAKARLQAAQWRALTPALGLPGVPEEEARRGRAALAGMVGLDTIGIRAAWSLSVAAYHRGDLAEARRWRSRVTEAADDTAGARLSRLLAALDASARGDVRVALGSSAALLGHDHLGEPLLPSPTPGLGDPFARALFHLRRGEWLAAQGDEEAADAEWQWYENQDLVGWPSQETQPGGVDEAQPGEVDMALGTYARWRLGVTAVEGGWKAAAGVCRGLERALELWSDADSAYGPLLRQGEAARARCPGVAMGSTADSSGEGS